MYKFLQLPWLPLSLRLFKLTLRSKASSMLWSILVRPSQQTLFQSVVVVEETVSSAEVVEESQEVLLLQPLQTEKSLLGYIIASVCMLSIKSVVLKVLSQSVQVKALKSSRPAKKSGLPSTGLWLKTRFEKSWLQRNGEMPNGSLKRKLNSWLTRKSRPSLIGSQLLIFLKVISMISQTKRSQSGALEEIGSSSMRDSGTE